MKIKGKLVKAANTKSNNGFDAELKRLGEILNEIRGYRHDESATWGDIQDALFEAAGICKDLATGAKARDDGQNAVY
jgi:hypothetical protein